jgi:aminoglycoside 3-N-acetyltransferase
MGESVDRPLVTRSQLLDDLCRLGVGSGDTLILHASVRAIGWIVGGPRTILDALLELLTPRGTLMMLASWEGNPYGMASWPAAQRAAWLAECPAFDPVTSPADHREMGILAEYLRTWPGARRSDHPLASFVAVGARAEELTRDHPWQYGHGPDSPLARLCAAGGAVLLLGSVRSNITLLHHAEHLARIPDKRIDRYTMPVLRDGERVWVTIEEYDTTNGIADFCVDDEFAAIAREYLAAGHGREGRVGAAEAALLPAADLVRFGITWMEAHWQGRADNALTRGEMDLMTVQIRAFRDADPPALWEVFHAAVHGTASADYTQEQIDAWSPAEIDQERWAERMRAIAPFVAEEEGRVIGYADVQADGYIDHFFVASSAGRRGVGSALMRQIHERAAERGIAALYSNVSITARPFFEHWGFVVEAEQRPIARGVPMTNFLMRKRLGTSA